MLLALPNLPTKSLQPVFLGAFLAYQDGHRHEERCPESKFWFFSLPGMLDYTTNSYEVCPEKVQPLLM